jgi:hypothetical protein
VKLIRKFNYYKVLSLLLILTASPVACQNNTSKPTLKVKKLDLTQTSASKFNFDSLLFTNPFIKQTCLDSNKAVQIIYTQINRDQNNQPSFKNYTYHLDSSKYFYAASLVKLPSAILALQKMNEINQLDLKKKPIEIKTTMLTNANGPCQKNVISDPLSFNQLPNLDTYIRRMLLVSDDEAFSRVFEFLTSDYIHTQLEDYGFPDIRIWHRFDPLCKGKDNDQFNSIQFINSEMNAPYTQLASASAIRLKHPLGKIYYGKSQMIGEKMESGAKNFSSMNFMSLQNTHEILRRIMFDEYLKPNERFNIKNDQIVYLRKLLAMYPSEAKFPNYQKNQYFDAYTKYLFYGNLPEAKINPQLRIFNKVGFSYGWVSDIAYFCDFETKTEFMLSAVIYTNEDGIMGDGNYEYKTVAYPFMKALGEWIYNYELKRKKTQIPDLKYLHQTFNEKTK